MARTLFLLALTGVLVAMSWRRLQQVPVPWSEILPLLALAVLPTAAAAAARSRLGAARARLATGAALLATTILAASVSFEIPLTDAQPRDPQRDFFGPVLDGIQRGFLDFYETRLPFNGLDFQLMHAVVLLAVFGFTALAGVFVVFERPVAASLVLVAGVGWPGTLNAGDHAVRAGALALVGVLAVLFLLRSGARPARGLPQAAAVGAVLVAVAVAASTSDAVAKPAFLSWQDWDPYDRPEDPVSVNYVWGSNYGGISFPEKATTVLRVKVDGPRRSLYWRATTLDDYTGQAWDEDLALNEAEAREQVDADGELLPAAARDEEEWVRQDVTVEALRDTHLLGSAQPVRWRPGTDAPVQDANGDVVVLPRSLQRGQRYTVWSYVPQAKPSELVRFGGNYPAAVDRFLEVAYEPVPEWGTESRSALMAVFFDRHAQSFDISSHEPLYEQAQGVTANARTPYEAAVLLEAWFRQGGGFAYDEQPPGPLGGEPPLVAFVTDHKRGYCQHYAGAMAVMLRLLGVPARVAAGFTSGRYDPKEKEWVVTDHNAHTWVEVWFPGFGWLPFDPTPGRGQLAATYSFVSGELNAGDAAEAAGGALLQALEGISPSQAEDIRARAQRGRGQLETAGGQAAAGGGSGAAAAVRDRGPSLVGLVLLVLGVAYAAVVLLKAGVRALRFAARNPRELAAAYRRDVVGYLADQGMTVPASATLPDIGSTLDRYYAVNAEPFVRNLALARFGPPGEATQALRRARRDLRDVRRQLRRAVGLPSRLRGAASLRSLTL
ncbi:MAG TPA: transglutaminaseTgpA domain-containing protein [Gaiellaceae bacterium]|nr:transglutaminaseTgpA domain-containing protein [Gaiellaceae bacterium]